MNSTNYFHRNISTCIYTSYFKTFVLVFKNPQCGHNSLEKCELGVLSLGVNISQLPRKCWFILSWEVLGKYTAISLSWVELCFLQKICWSSNPQHPRMWPCGGPDQSSLEVQGLLAMRMCAGKDRAVLLCEKPLCPTQA